MLFHFGHFGELFILWLGQDFFGFFQALANVAIVAVGVYDFSQAVEFPTELVETVGVGRHFRTSHFFADFLVPLFNISQLIKHVLLHSIKSEEGVIACGGMKKGGPTS